MYKIVSLLILLLLIVSSVLASSTSDATFTKFVPRPGDIPASRTILTTNSGTDWMPSWSPDGTRIVYVSSPNVIDNPIDPSQDIYVISATGGDPVKLTDYDGFDGYRPKYSPDGSMILYSSSAIIHENDKACAYCSNLWIIPSNGGVASTLKTNSNAECGIWAPPSYKGYPASYPPDFYFAYVSAGVDYIGRPIPRYIYFDGHKMDFPYSDRSTENGNNPDWSPGGYDIIYDQAGDLWDADLKGGIPNIKINKLTNTPDWQECYPTYSPDGKYIAFISNRSGKSGLWFMPSSGGEQKLIIDDDGVLGNPSWSPDGTKIAVDRGSKDNEWAKDLWIVTDLPIINSIVSAESIAIHGDYLWIAGGTKMYRLDPDNGYTIKTVDYTFAGLTFADNYIYGIGGAPVPAVDSKTIYKLDPKDGTILSSLPLESDVPSPCSLAYDGKYFWIGSQESGKIYKVDPITGLSVQSFDAPNKNPSGLAHDGVSLWVATNNPNMIFEVNPVDGSIISSSAAPISGSLTGLDFDENSSLWAVTAGTGDIYKVSVEGIRAKPKLSLEPAILDFGNIESTMTLKVSNVGGAILTWKIVGSLPGWIKSINPMDGTVNGTGDTNVTITIDRSFYTKSETKAFESPISIESDGGDETITIKMTAPELKPKLSVSTKSINFGASDDQSSFNISNTGGGILKWSINGTLPKWLNLSTINGEIAPGKSVQISLNINKQDLELGKYNYTITITSNGGNEDIIVELNLSTQTSIPIVKTVSIESQPGVQIIAQLNITDASGVASGDITIEYDPSILSVGDIKSTNLTSSMNLTINKNISGQIKIVMAGSTGIASGSGSLVDMNMTVNANAKVGTETKLHIANAELYDEVGKAIPINIEDGTVKVKQACIKGDVNGDGNIKSNDATLILRIAAGLLEPNDYQKCAADFNGDGKIASNDAMLVLRKAAGLEAPSKDLIADRHISVSLSEAHGLKGETITVPIVVDNIDILSSGDMSISYDSKVLRAIDVLVSPSNEEGTNNGLLMANNISQPGLIRISFAGVERLNNGKLAEIKFEVLTDDVSPLIFKMAELYSPDALLLISKVTNKQFRSWAVAPERSALLQNYPNPFNPETWIPYQLHEANEVVIRIYNITGELVRELRLGYKPVGQYTTQDRSAYWDGRNEAGERVSSGVYFYNIQAGKYSSTMKMIVTK
jgi:Tol biopolymer transport system component